MTRLICRHWLKLPNNSTTLHCHFGLALQLYTGPKAMLAKEKLSDFFYVTCGVAAGCPQAPLLAKTYLAPALQPFVQQQPRLHLNGWVDDLEAANPQEAAGLAVQGWRDLKPRLDQLGLRVNAQKTAFTTVDRATTAALRPLLGGSSIAPVLRDLGIDHQARRFCRIPVLKGRFHKCTKRKLKLRSLRSSLTAQRRHSTCHHLSQGMVSRCFKISHDPW